MSVPRPFVNISNHPSAGWSEAQRHAVTQLVDTGEIIDLPFPNVPPDAGLREIAALRDLVLAALPERCGACMVAGEPTLVLSLVRALQEQEIPCFAATTRREVVEQNHRKTSVFTFERFRPYPPIAGPPPSRTSVLPQVSVTRLALVYQATGAISLADYLGTALRGTLGRALREVACRTGAERCEGCEHLRRCEYAALWEPQARAAVPLPPGFGSPPAPYVVVPPTLQRRHIEAGERLSFEVRLFGQQAKTAASILRAARRPIVLGATETPPLVLAAAHLLDADGHPLPPTPAPESAATVAIPGELAGVDGRARLELRTPLDLRDKGPFAVALTKNLIRRLENLSTLYGTGEPPRWDRRRLEQLAERVTVHRRTFEIRRLFRYSQAQGARVPMVGRMGSVDLHDVAPRLLALWRCAAIVHAGRGTIYGFGALHVVTP